MKRKLTGDENLHRGSAVVPLPFNENTAQVTHSSKKSKIEVALYPSPPAVLTSSVTADPVAHSVQPPPPKAFSIKISHCPSWKPIPDCFDRDRVEQHAFLREFAHRFYRQLRLTQADLDVLTTFEPIPEPTCKAMLIGLLGVIYDDEAAIGSKSHSQMLSDALKRLRRVRTNLDDIWDVLQSVKDCFTLGLAQPLHKDTVDDSLIRRSTRAGPQELLHASQLMPVLISLCEEGLHTSMIRQQLDDGVKETVQFNRERTSHVKAQTEKWDALRAEFKQHKENAKKNLPHDTDWNKNLQDARKQHQNALKEINVKHRIEVQGRNLRFAPLGIDHGGRIYYALAHPRPPAATKKSKGSSRKRQSPVLSSVPSVGERARFENWAYFIFVWGPKPPEAAPEVSDLMSQCTETEDDIDTERWWGFSEPGEVRTLAKWILTTALCMDHKAGTSALPMAGDGENLVTHRTSMSSVTITPSSPRHADKVRPLCKGLDEFADFLEVCFGEV